jgi:hypothetical protein
LAALQKDFADEDVVVVTICLGCSTEEAREGLKEANAEGILTLVDENMEAMMPYHASATPTTYLIDREGVIQMGDVGYNGSTKAHLRDEIKRLLEE